MDRVTVFPDQIPLETDILKTGQFGMVANAKLTETLLGTGTYVNGFALTATAPAGLSLNLGPGTIYQQEALEATPWSSLPADTAHLIQKQGISLDAISLTFTPPGSSGYSQSFLVEIQYQETDTGAVVRPYYDADNPDTQFNGPGGDGQADNTVRKGGVYALVKAGTAVNSGSPAAPAPDAGFVGLYVVTIANGATQITASNFLTYTGAPFLLSTLPGIPAGVQSGAWDYARDTGTANALAFSLNPVPGAYSEGRKVRIKAAYPCTGASTANANGIGARSIRKSGGALTTGGEWAAGDIISLNDDGTNWQLTAVFGATATTSSSPVQTSVGDTNYTIQTGDKRLVTTAAFTANRTWTLPSAATFGIGDILFTDRIGAVTAGNTLTFVPNGLDQIDGGTSFVVGNPFRAITLRCDGTSTWTVDRGVATAIHRAGDANVTILPYDTTVATSVALTAARTWTLPSAASVAAGTTILLTDLFGACSGSFPVTIARAGCDTINGVTSLTMTTAYFQLFAVSDGAGRWAIQYVDLSQVAALFKGTADGGCYLTVTSPTGLLLSPKNGNTVVVNGVPVQVPGAGISAVNVVGGVPATANTLYYVYVQVVSGALTLQLSTTGYTTDTSGRANKTGDATQRLVGAVYTNASAQFENDATFRGVSNFFNRQTLLIDSGVTTSQTIPTGGSGVSGANAPIDSAVPFFSWAGEKTDLFAVATTSTGSVNIIATVYVDGSGTGYYGSNFPVTGHAAFSGGGQTSGNASLLLSEGVHTTQGIMNASVSGGAGTATVDYARHFGYIRG